MAASLWSLTRGLARRRFVRAYVARPHWPLWIDNEDVEGRGPVLDVLNPATGAVAATCASADAADVDAAVASGTSAWSDWRDLGAIGRGRVLRRAADALRAALPAVVDLETAHTGRPRREYLRRSL